MTVYVAGDAQSIPLARCLAVMLPGIRVERLGPGVPFGANAADGDVVFRQRDRRTAPSSDGLGDNEFAYPRIRFDAFHPDLVRVRGPAGPVAPPMGEYHSSLVLYAWQRELSAAQTARLFCEPVFERLGFFGRWDAAKQALLAEGRAAGMTLDAMFARWERGGAFMHAVNRPALTVVADVARALAQRAGLPTLTAAPEQYVNDPLLRDAVWPVYPEIAARLGLSGAYAFKPAQPAGAMRLLDLDGFIARSFEAYAQMPPGALACERLDDPAYRDLEGVPAARRARARAAAPEDSPYANLPASRFWRRAVERVPVADVDPVGAPPFRVDRGVRIATAGSCFAQTMSRALTRHGYQYFVAEPAPAELSPDEARRAGYGVFSTRCGNVYTARQLLQLFDRAYGTFAPSDRAWLRADGRYADPFRPRIEPDGFATVDDLLAAREQHLAAVRTMFEQLDVLIFTLGLTEAWRATADGAVFPLAPGVAAGKADPARYEFVNFTAAEVRDDLDAFITRLVRVNSAARIVLTVSPQPPVATYEPRHVLVSATYTKAALRVAADEIERMHRNVWYFPGYELIAGSYNGGAYYEPDLRTVTPAGVEHVMRLFFAHGSGGEAEPRELDALQAAENEANMDVVCDEDEIVRYRVPAATAMDGALAPSSMRAPVSVALPREMTALALVSVPCTIRNDGDAVLASAGTHPVFLCYRWFDEHGQLAEIGRSIHTSLPEPLAPGTQVELPMRIAAPQDTGRYRIHVALLQSEVAWFDDVDPSNGAHGEVGVTAGTLAPAVSS